MLFHIHNWLIVVSDLRLKILTENFVTKLSQMTEQSKHKMVVNIPKEMNFKRYDDDPENIPQT